ncbi:alpha/beta fold hydrolase [uncultured Friedmanniella sp.]|uniref:alpha/beta fold hydrolase n=1 Tax=uncultured Friedmanniella sp. TaxID=335381 RepID=UPI0035C98CC3
MAPPEAPGTPAAALTGLPDVDPAWSRFVEVADADGVSHRWHVLERPVADSTVAEGSTPVATMLCVHGNPTWSFLWRRFLAAAPPGWRVVAVDQLGMGLSARTAQPRTLARRVADLGDLTAALGITGPVVTVGHDWGGIISAGWALAHRDQLRGVVLTNTAVHLADGDAGPGLIRLAQTPLLRNTVCVRTPVFLRGASALSRPSLPAAVRRGLELPYGSADRRGAIGDFVADVPFDAQHPSAPALAAIAAGLTELADVPALLMWGPRDPVFAERYLEDLLTRLPHADVQRYPRASHLVTEDAPQTAADAWRWIGERTGPDAVPPVERPAGSSERLWLRLLEHADDPTTAVVELSGGERRSVTFAELNARIRNLGAGLAASGVRPGDRVALLVPPGIDLTVAVYACWQAGAAIVVADAGLGLRGMAHALRSAAPQHVIGIPKALVAMAALRVPGRRIVVGGSDRVARVFGWTAELTQLERLGADRDLPDLPVSSEQGGDEGAVLFTSGATGPAKGVVYLLPQLRAQIDQIAAVLRLGPEDRLVAAFAPFALYAPAIGIGAAVPDMDVTAPNTLTATALADAVEAIDATSVFASPAALRNVVATAGALDDRQRSVLAGVRTVLSAGAPVPASLLRQVQTVLPGAELHTPYGMTEVLPATDISLAQIETAQIEVADAGNGVCVGWPLPSVTLSLSPMDELGRAEGALTTEPGVTGEILIAAPHRKQRYDRLWATEQQSSRNAGFHRSGDVGHLDPEGRLWVEGRLVHVVTTADGPVTPVGIEQRIELLDAVSAAAIVGVGPTGTQQVVAVVVPAEPGSGRGLAPPPLADEVRAASPVPLAAVLVTDALPVDIRHASKVDRARVARWAGGLLAGERVGRLAKVRR